MPQIPGKNFKSIKQKRWPREITLELSKNMFFFYWRAIHSYVFNFDEDSARVNFILEGK